MEGTSYSDTLLMIDIGNPQLSMHSIRETGGTDDVKHGIDLFKVKVRQTKHGTSTDFYHVGIL